MTGEGRETTEGVERGERPEPAETAAERRDDAIEAVADGELPLWLLDDLRERPAEAGDEPLSRDAWGWAREAGETRTPEAAESPPRRIERLRRIAGRLPAVAAIGALGVAACAVAAGASPVVVAGAAWGFYGFTKNAAEAVEDLLEGVGVLPDLASAMRDATRRLLSRRRGP